MDRQFSPHSLDELAVEVLDAMSLIDHKELPAPVAEKSLVPHADLVRRHHHRLQLFHFSLSPMCRAKHLPPQLLPLWDCPVIENHWNLLCTCREKIQCSLKECIICLLPARTCTHSMISVVAVSFYSQGQKLGGGSGTRVCISIAKSFHNEVS